MPFFAVDDQRHGSGSNLRLFRILRSSSCTSPSWELIRIVCISDAYNAHGDLAPLPDGDILIHAGDFTQSGTLTELNDALSWLDSQSHSHKIFVAGNHDTALAGQRVSAYVRDTYPNLTYLQDESLALTIKGRVLNVYGSPNTPKHGSWAFQYPRVPTSQAQNSDVWSSIPLHTDILIIHGPPAYHLDLSGSGCNALLAALWRIHPRLHDFGHIHGGRGIECLRWTKWQNAYERICAREGGWWILFVLLFGVVQSLYKGRNRDRGNDGTILLNAAAMGGFPDELLREAIVIDI